MAERMADAVAADYDAITAEADASAAESEAVRRRVMARLRRELQRVERRDYFPPNERDAAKVAVERLAATVVAR